MADAGCRGGASPRQELLSHVRASRHVGYGYALWLVPPAGSEAALRLRAAQRRLNPALAFHHPPHATLLCHLRSLPQARAVAAAVAAAQAPFQITVAARVQACQVRYAVPGDHGTERIAAPPDDDCRAVHAAAWGAGFEAACRAAHAAAAAWHLASGGDAAGVPAPFRPHEGHISLAYRYASAGFSELEVAAMDQAAGGASACVFEADRVVVASAHGPWPDWRVIEALPMRGAEWAAAPAESAVPLAPDVEDAV